MKKTSLQTVMYVQAAVAFCIPVYYYFMVTYEVNSNLPLLITILILILIGKIKSRAEVIDEYAKETQQIADSICDRTSIVMMGILILSLLFIRDVSTLSIGYLLTISIFVLVLLRACVFYWIANKGMGTC